ncbi:MAG: ATP-binding protein, partial [Pseudomonadota bacterium]
GLDLFTPFETTKREGMGMGLSICRTLIEVNHGEIWHEPDVETTRFCIKLPLEGEA